VFFLFFSAEIKFCGFFEKKSGGEEPHRFDFWVNFCLYP
jgi:hypothetical protein